MGIGPRDCPGSSTRLWRKGRACQAGPGTRYHQGELPPQPAKEEAMTTALQARSLVPTMTANDLERSIRFYEGLGFKINEKMEDGGKLLGVMMEAGGATLGISQDDFAKGKD